jgi:hypothetical protein
MVILSGTILYCFTGCLYVRVGYTKDTIYAKKTKKTGVYRIVEQSMISLSGKP